MHWCKREMRWAADWLFRAYLWEGKSDGDRPPTKWGKNDKLVIMARLSLFLVLFCEACDCAGVCFQSFRLLLGVACLDILVRSRRSGS